MEDGRWRMAKKAVRPVSPSSIFHLPSLIFEVPMPPTFQPRRPFHRRTRSEPAPSAPAGTVSVLSVTVDGTDDAWAFWEFTHAVTTDGGGAPQLSIDTINGTQYPSESQQITPTKIRYHFDDSGIAPEQTWNLNGQPSGLDLHGRTMVSPESGSVGE